MVVVVGGGGRRGGGARARARARGARPHAADRQAYGAAPSRAHASFTVLTVVQCCCLRTSMQNTGCRGPLPATFLRSGTLKKRSSTLISVPWLAAAGLGPTASITPAQCAGQRSSISTGLWHINATRPGCYAGQLTPTMLCCAPSE